MNQIISNEKLNIACIDDDEIYTFLIKKVIVRSEIASKINFFYNGRTALDYILENAGNANKLPDLIFLDINMPVLDGWQFLEEFENIQSDLVKKIAIYITSSTIDQYDHERAKSFKSISCFISKKITIDILHDIQVQIHK